MLGFVKVVALVYFQLIFIECLIPSLVVRKIDNGLVNRKRQDTREMCKIFSKENERKREPETKAYEYIAKLKRGKRNIDDQVVGQHGMNAEDMQRVENIVDQLYDDDLNMPKKMGQGSRRFDFAPAFLLGPGESTSPAPEIPPVAPVAVKWPKRWPKGVIPFFIDSKTYDMALAEIIIKAFDYFEKSTCIRLQRLREKPTDQKSLSDVEWLYISNPSGINQCVHSNEHKKNQGVQMVVFGYDCMSQGEIVHEVMHILGFSHEHTRPDRDRYVTIMWDNIKPGYKKYFQLRTEDPLMGLPYDYSSVLHYPQRAFSKNGQITVLAEPGEKIGQRDGLSQVDIEKVGLIYSGECVNRNMDYLLQTCPSVVKSNEEPVDVSKDEIDDYFNGRIWPYGIINYKLRDKMEFSAEERENIKAVLRHIERETCIEFRELNSYEKPDEDNEFIRVPDYDVVQEVYGGEDLLKAAAKTTGDTLTDQGQSAAPLTDKDDAQVTDKDGAAQLTDKQETDKQLTEHMTDQDQVGEQKTDQEKTDSRKTDQEQTGEPKTDQEKIDSRKTDQEQVVAQKTDQEQTDSHKTDKEQTGTQKTDQEKTDSPKTDQEKTGSAVLTDGPVPVAQDANELTDHAPAGGPNSRRRPMKGATRKHMSPPLSPSRRHAKNIYVITRKNEPGCPCPAPGKPEGDQVLAINTDCFNTVNDLLHLFIHVLGLEHQHNMHDRDQYLQIVWDNISSDIKDELQNVLPPAASVGFPYDYQSVMHYPWLEIKDGVTNIMYPIWNDGWAMGHWQGLSWTDVQKINFLYRRECVKRKTYADKA